MSEPGVLEESERSTHPTVSRTFLQQLKRAEVDTVFGLPGSAIGPLFDALLDEPGINLVECRHESAAAFAAAGYARASGRIGVAFVTSGPGLLNALNGLASAKQDGLPVVLIGGEVATQWVGKGALQEGASRDLDLVAVAAHLTKATFVIREPHMAALTLQRAISTAMSGKRGPVFVSVHVDVLRARTPVPRFSHEVIVTPKVSGALLDEVAELLQASPKKIIFAGSGCRWGRTSQLLIELSERLGAPVVTTLKGKGVFPETHANSRGIFSFGGHPSAQKAFSEDLDCLLVVGSSLSEEASNGWSPLISRAASIVQIDIDTKNVSRNYPVTHALIGHAETVLSELLERLPLKIVAPPEGALQRYEDASVEPPPSEMILSIPRVLWELQQICEPDTFFTCDIGEHHLFAAHYLEMGARNDFMIMSGVGSMGSSIGAAIGIKAAMPERQVVAVCGDGGFAMSLPEIATCAAARIPLVVVVINNRKLGMVEFGQSAIFGRSHAFSLRDLSIPDVARGLGAACFSVAHPGELLSGLQLPLTLGRPLVIDVRVDPHAQMPRNNRLARLAKIITLNN